MKRIVAVDIAKAICIILVVIGHYFPDNSPEWYIMLHNLIYTFHMPLFMFASGYIYMETWKDESYGRFISKKIRRLMIPYFTMSVLVVTIKLLSQNIVLVEDPVSWHSYLAILYSTSAADFFWFIWALFIIFLIIPLFKTKNTRLYLFLGSMVFEFLPISLPDLFCLPQVKDMLVYFMLGVIIVDHKVIQQTALKTPSVLVYILFLGLFSLRIKFGDNVLSGSSNYWLYLLVKKVIPYAGIFSICKLSVSISHFKINPNHWLLIIAANSYIIYFFHTTFMGFSKAILTRIPVLADTKNQLLFAAGAISVILIGVLSPILLNNLVLQKNKILCYLFGLNYPKSRTQNKIQECIVTEKIL
jgi:fucose 4-O-acetylase-like acetyltransferase